ncbi:MAG: succinate dehydrogenase cytochrome b subunit [Verrucomicrobiota bacterium]
MNVIKNIFGSSLGKKFVMAGSGFLLFLFVVGHLIGNLQIFGPPEMINRYAHFLKSTAEVLWVVRAGMLALVALHILTAIQLSLENKAARPVGYATPGGYGAKWQSRYMLVSGLVVLSFIVYHLAHFTVLLPGINGVGDFTKLTTTLHGETVPDVYGMIVLGFQVGWVCLFYLVAQALLFVHLGHGLEAMFQSLGLRNHAWFPTIKKFARVVSIAIFVGYSLIPVSIYMHVIGADYAEKARASLIDSSVSAAKEAK